MGHHDVRNPVGSVVPAAGVFAGAEGAAAQQEGAGLLHKLVDDGLAGVRGVEIPVIEASRLSRQGPEMHPSSETAMSSSKVIVFPSCRSHRRSGRSMSGCPD